MNEPIKQEKDLRRLLKTLQPTLHVGNYVFCKVEDVNEVDIGEVISLFKEGEGTTVILKKEIADQRQLEYNFIAAWITLTVHSSLEAVGLTAAFSKALANENISCNVVAAYYHDHIFVERKDAEKAMAILNNLSSD